MRICQDWPCEVTSVRESISMALLLLLHPRLLIKKHPLSEKKNRVVEDIYIEIR